MSSQNHFAPLRDAEFIVLTTYRRSGAAVPTTVWFAAVDDVLYVTTSSTAGKAKRIRNNSQVQVAPSDQVGNLQGPAIPARARLLDPAEYAPAVAALQQKYGEMFSVMTARMDAARSESERIYLVVEPH